MAAHQYQCSPANARSRSVIAGRSLKPSSSPKLARGCETKIFRVQGPSEGNRGREFSQFAARCRPARAGRFRAAANPCAAAQPLGEPGNFAVSVRVQNFQRSYLLRPTPTLVKKFSKVLPTVTYCDFGPPSLRFRLLIASAFASLWPSQRFGAPRRRTKW